MSFFVIGSSCLDNIMYFLEELDKLDKFSAASNVDPDRYIFLAENAQIVVNENELLKVNSSKTTIK